jgi:O-antigen/teichoic acid export membrane protein
LLKHLFSRLSNPILRDSLFVLISNIVAQGMNFLSLIILARYFGPDQIALYTTSLILLTLLLSLADSGLSNSIVNLVNQKAISSKNEMYKYLKAGLIIRLGLGLLISFMGLGGSEYLAINIYNSSNLKDLFIFAFLGVAVLSLHSYISMIYQTQNKFKTRSYYQITTSIIRISALFILFLFPDQITIRNAFSIYVFSPLVVMIFHFSEILRILKQPLSMNDFSNKVKLIYSYSKWLFLSMIAVLLLSRLDQFMLLKMVTVKEVGYYAIATQLIMVLPLITESLTTVLLPKVANIHTDLKLYSQQIIKKVGPVSLLLLLLIPFAELIIVILFGESYEPAVPIFQILVIGFSLDITINLLSLVFYSTSKVWYLTILNYIQLVMVIIGNMLLIPTLQAFGAAVSAVIVRVFALIYILYFSKKVIKKTTLI